jgi:hypothetical protein
VNCPKCGFKVPMRAEHCYNCGEAITRDFNVLSGAIQDDAADERGEKLAGIFKVILVLLIIACAVMYAVNDYFDTPLTYSPAMLQSIPSSGGVGLELPNLRKPPTEPNTSPSLPSSLVTAFNYRTEPMRSQLRTANDGETPGAPTRNRIQGALQYMGQQQLPDGSWSVQVYPKALDQWRTGEWQGAGKVGVTALATLAFLGEGITWLPDPAGGKHAHAARVQKAIAWLLKQQDVDGHFGTQGEDKINFIYNHPIATMAIIEAAGLTGEESLRAAAQRGLDVRIKSQNDKGGWDYFGKAGAKDGTASISLWPVLALAEGLEAGFKVPPASLEKAQGYFRALTQPDGRVQFGPGAADDNQFRIALCGHALLVRTLLGEDPRSGSLTPLLNKMKTAMVPVKREWGLGWQGNRPNNDDEKRAFIDPLLLFSATHGMFCAGGADWQDWNIYMKQTLADMQDTDSAWRMNDPFSKFGGTIYSTALSVMTLQVYYRFPSAALKSRGGGGALGE